MRNQNEDQKIRSKIRIKVGTVAALILLAGITAAGVVAATPGSRPEKQSTTENKTKSLKQNLVRDLSTNQELKPSKVDIDARKAAFVENVAAKVEAGELTQAEADDMIAGLENRLAEFGRRDAKLSIVT